MTDIECLIVAVVGIGMAQLSNSERQSFTNLLVNITGLLTALIAMGKALSN